MVGSHYIARRRVFLLLRAVRLLPRCANGEPLKPLMSEEMPNVSYVMATVEILTHEERLL